MVDDGRKVAEMEPDELDGAETLTTSATTTTGNPSLKMKISLRNQQPMRKRHRSSSPTNSSDSSSTYGSTRSSSRSNNQAVGSNNARSSSLKRNRHSNDEDDGPQADTPPSSNRNHLSPPLSTFTPPLTFILFFFFFFSEEDAVKSNGIDSPNQLMPEVKKVRIGALTPSVTMEPAEKKPNLSPVDSSIILVDMNGDADEIKTEKVAPVDPPSDSPPASPAIDDGSEDLQLKMDEDSKTEDLPVKTVKRITRDVNPFFFFQTSLPFRFQIKLNFLFRILKKLLWSKWFWPFVSVEQLVNWRRNLKKLINNCRNIANVLKAFRNR